MSAAEPAGVSPSAKPKHLQREYAEQFQDQSVVDAYHLRPPYPQGLFSILGRLVDPACPRVLDIGCGTGEVARRFAPKVERVDAVDISPAMLAKGKRLPGGAVSSLRWIEGPMENVPLDPPYGLVTAASSLHWMEWSLVLPRLAQVVSAKGVLAIVFEHSGPAGPNLEELTELVRKFSTNQDYQAFDLAEELQQLGFFILDGEEWTETDVFRQPIADYVGSFHARNGFSRGRMGTAASDEFDRQAERILRSAFPAGELLIHMTAQVVWGKPINPEQTKAVMQR